MDQEKEIDLRPLVLALVRHWYVLAIGAAVAMAGSWLWISRTPPRYTSAAQVLVVASRMNADFKSGIELVEPLPDLAALVASIAQFATAGDVVQAVIERLGPELPENLRDPAALASILSATSSEKTGIITLGVTYGDREVTAKVANAWADALVTEGNQIYGATRGSQLVSSIQQQSQAARQSYEQKEQALADFVASDDSPVLRQRMEEYRAAVDSLRLARSTVISQTAAIDAIAATEVISSYARVRWAGQAAVIGEAERQAVQRLQDAYAALRRLELLRGEVAALRDHLAAGGDPQSAALALQLLKARAFAADGDLPANLQLQVSPSSGASVADAEAILQTIDTRIVALQASIETQAKALADGSAIRLPEITAGAPPASDLSAQYADLLSGNLMQQVIGTGVISPTAGSAVSDEQAVALQQQVQRLEAQLQMREVQRFVLEQERDAARAAYRSFQLKLAELMSENLSDGQAVLLVSKAAGATQVSEVGQVRQAALAGVAALVLLAMIILAREIVVPWLRESSRRPAGPPPEMRG